MFYKWSHGITVKEAVEDRGADFWMAGGKVMVHSKEAVEMTPEEWAEVKARIDELLGGRS